MGVEVDQPTVPLTIAGNVYAASDYYNKQYNESTWDEDVSDDSKKLTTSDTYEIEQEDGENVRICIIHRIEQYCKIRNTIVHLQMVCLHRASQQIS